MTFSQPSAGGDTFEPKSHLGKLLLVYPKSYDPAMLTKASSDPTPAADVDILIIDELGPDGKPVMFSNARLFGNLAKSVRNDLGGQVLGRLAQGDPSPGRTAPWILTSFTDADAAMAGPVHQQYQAGHFKAPAANPMQPPAAGQQTWQAPAPQATGAAPAAWQNAGAPAAAATPPPAAPSTPAAAQWQPPAAPAASSVDPSLVDFLEKRGIPVTPAMTQEQCVAIANSFPQ